MNLYIVVILLILFFTNSGIRCDCSLQDPLCANEPSVTLTSTPTISDTASATPSPVTQSATPTPIIISPSLSSIPSHTLTPTAVVSSSSSASATTVVSASHSSSGTHTSTPSITSTTTSTVSASSSRTTSHSGSITPSQTPTTTQSLSNSVSRTPSRSVSSTPSQTPSITPILSSSSSRTPSHSSSNTSTALHSASATPIETQLIVSSSSSRTPIHSSSASESSSRTSSSSSIASPSKSPTPTRSSSRSVSRSPSPSNSPSETRTASVSPTPAPSGHYSYIMGIQPISQDNVCIDTYVKLVSASPVCDLSCYGVFLYNQFFSDIVYGTYSILYHNNGNTPPLIRCCDDPSQIACESQNNKCTGLRTCSEALDTVHTFLGIYLCKHQQSTTYKTTQCDTTIEFNVTSFALECMGSQSCSAVCYENTYETCYDIGIGSISRPDIPCCCNLTTSGMSSSLVTVDPANARCTQSGQFSVRSAYFFWKYETTGEMIAEYAANTGLQTTPCNLDCYDTNTIRSFVDAFPFPIRCCT